MERRSASKGFGGRSARYGAGGDIAAQCPYLNPAGEMFAYVRLCSLNWKKMFEAGGIDQEEPGSD